MQSRDGLPLQRTRLEAEGSLTISETARLNPVSKTTLYHRIKRRRDQLSYAFSKQRLMPKEEESIQYWVKEIQSWGFPSRVAQLRDVDKELLQAKHDFNELSKIGLSIVIFYNNFIIVIYGSRLFVSLKL